MLASTLYHSFHIPHEERERVFLSKTAQMATLGAFAEILVRRHREAWDAKDMHPCKRSSSFESRGGNRSLGKPQIKPEASCFGKCPTSARWASLNSARTSETVL